MNIFDRIQVLESTPRGDLLVVNAARASFDKESYMLDGKDIELLNYLAEHKHLLPFRHPSATLRVELPIFVARQLGKHQVGFSWSEMSRRYVDSAPEFYLPEKFRKKADNVKQGSGEDFGEKKDREYTYDMVVQNSECLDSYNWMLTKGVCAEQARMVLPQNMYTTIVWTGTLLAWFDMYKQRTDPHVQQETKEYAVVIGDYISELFPEAWNALIAHA